MAVSVCAAAVSEVDAYGIWRRPRVDERSVDLVGEDAAAVPVDHVGQLRHLIPGEDAPKRVVGVAEDEQVSSGAERRRDRVEVEGEEARRRRASAPG